MSRSRLRQLLRMALPIAALLVGIWSASHQFARRQRLMTELDAADRAYARYLARYRADVARLSQQSHRDAPSL